MIITAKNAEEALIADIKRHYESGTTTRCLYIRFSELGTMSEEFFHHFTNALEPISNGNFASVYMCGDRDVFILMQNLSHRSVDEFVRSLQDLSGLHDIEPLCSLYELRIDGSTIRNICARKLEKIEKARASQDKAAALKAEEREREKALSNLDAGLLTSLKSRRNKRTDTEILVVEDDALSRMLIKNVLSSDFSLCVVQDAQSAIFEYLEKAPDVVFLDIGLPDMSGHEVLQRLMQIDQESYVIMFSGRKDKENILKALELGAMGFIGKPFTRGKLYQYIEQCPTVQDKMQKKKPHQTSVL